MEIKPEILVQMRWDEFANLIYEADAALVHVAMNFEGERHKDMTKLSGGSGMGLYLLMSSD